MEAFTEHESEFLLNHLRDMERLINTAHEHVGSQETLELHERIREIKRTLKREEWA
ncbi:MAG: hypothetical protein ACYTGH_21455 [Planctomycetota bacterium]|jgi:hypothetical protein